MVKFAKDTRKRKKNVSRQNLEMKLNNGFQNQNSSSPRNSAKVSGSLNQHIMFCQFWFPSQTVTVTPLEKDKKHHEKGDIVYFDRQRPHQKARLQQSKRPRFMYSKKHCKKLEAKGSRAIFFLQF